ncbi:BrnT family toxin [Patescibacteria group bacterium]|nr:BrnT family toxin [Patescibacteria group bacterium]
MQYNFEWNYVKAKSNLQKHNINFERAAEIFLDPFMLSEFDDEHSEKEERWITIGKDRNNITIVVIHTFKEIDSDNSTVRIISARRATKKENKQYNLR